MSHSFNAQEGLILVKVEVTGPGGSAVLHLALDTGATTTLLGVAPVVAVGYDPAQAPDRIEATTATGVEYLPRISLRKLTALGQDRTDFPVLCHTLPPSTGIDGLLGLDFFRGHVLTLDFHTGEIRIA